LQDRYVIGIDAGGTKVAYGLFKSGGYLVDRFQQPTDIEADGPTFSDGIIQSVHQLLEKNHIKIDQLNGIGICMPSFILFDDGHVCLTSAMTNIKDFGLRDYIASRLDVPIVLDNDCNVAALAEHRHGVGVGSKHMVYMAASTGIGSGIIINGELFRGSYGWAGESGHMIATPDQGIECGCENKGCFMSYASGRYAPKFAKMRMADGIKSCLSQYKDLDCTHILKACKNGDALAIETVERMAHYLAVCLFNIYQLLNINLFVFGGGLVNFGDELFARVRAKFDGYNHISQPVDFRFAQLEKDFGIVGAAELIDEIKYDA
jgi:glucokinase